MDAPSNRTSRSPNYSTQNREQQPPSTTRKVPVAASRAVGPPRDFKPNPEAEQPPIGASSRRSSRSPTLTPPRVRSRVRSHPGSGAGIAVCACARPRPCAARFPRARSRPVVRAPPCPAPPRCSLDSKCAPPRGGRQELTERAAPPGLHASTRKTTPLAAAGRWRSGFNRQAWRSLVSLGRLGSAPGN